VSKLFSEMNMKDSRGNDVIPITIADAKALLKQWKS
jgi:hypothetical protein